MHRIDIDTTNNTGDANFWESGCIYSVHANTAKTVDSTAIDGAKVFWFTIEYQYVVTAASIRDAVLNRLLAGNHDTNGTVGKLLQILDALISSRLAAASYAAPDNAGILAIKQRTDNLPNDPADASDIAAAFATVNGTLTIIAGYVDTEIAAIKLVTEKLNTTLEVDGGVYRFTTNALEQAPSTPIDVSAIAAATSVLVLAGIGAIEWTPRIRSTRKHASCVSSSETTM